MITGIVTTLLVNTIVFSVLFGFLFWFSKEAIVGQDIGGHAICVLLAIVVLKLIIPFGFESAISPLGWIDNHSALSETAQSEAWQPEPYAI